MTETEGQKAQVAAPAAESPKRAKTVGTLAVVAGLVAAVVGLVDVLAGKRDIIDILLFVGGLLVSLAGLRMLRRARSS